MAEESFPIVDKPMSAAQWSAVTRGIGNGILDEGGFPYRLIFKSDANATNQGILKCPTLEGKKYGQAILDGFYHKYDSDLVLDFPAVTKSTRYYVVLQYVPTRASEGEMPVQAEVVTSLDYTQGKDYLHLYNVDREPNQLLMDATVRMIRPRVAPVQVYASEADMPRADKSLWGTLAVVHGGRNSNNAKIFMAMNSNASGADDDNQWFWKLIYGPSDDKFEWTDKGSTDSYRSPAAGGYTRAIGRKGKRRRLRGRVERPTGAKFVPGTRYAPWSGVLDPQDWPSRVASFITSVSGTGPSTIGFARIEISNEGTIGAWVSNESDWISLDGVEWEVP